MTHLEQMLGQLARFLDERHQPWALVGGLAVSVRTEPRFTRDLDIALAISNDSEAEALVYDLHAVGFIALACMV